MGVLVRVKADFGPLSLIAFGEFKIVHCVTTVILREFLPVSKMQLDSQEGMITAKKVS